MSQEPEQDFTGYGIVDTPQQAMEEVGPRYLAMTIRGQHVEIRVGPLGPRFFWRISRRNVPPQQNQTQGN